MTSLENLNELNDVQLDVLREIGNIGSGNAATALSKLMSTKINISVPTVKTYGFSEIMGLIGNAEDIEVGLLLKIEGDISGLILYFFKSEFAEKVINAFYEKKIDNLLDLTEMDKSTISEIGNIMAGSYVNAIAAMSNMKISLCVPEIAIDMAGAILSSVTVEYASLSDKILFVDDNFQLFEGDIKSSMILIPETTSLSKLFEALGLKI